MNAFHCNWTAPFFREKKNDSYFIEDFELLTTILSALKWRQHNGKIKMVTDKVGADYYKEIGLSGLWDLGIDDQLETWIPNQLDSNLFWAAGKIFALKYQLAPCVMIDTDFIVWKDIRQELAKEKLAVIHREPLLPDVYPSKEVFQMRGEYEYNSKWNWLEPACNTAFAYFGDEAFKQYYTEEAIRFMNHVDGGFDKLTYMVFAEQRMLALCAKEQQVEIHALMDLHTLHEQKQDTYTHIWGYKREIKKDFYTNEAFCKRCIRRIIDDFPEWEERLWSIPQLVKYLQQ
ncbi:MAG: DUF6734 family protein [Bacillaceae bacterium]